MSKSVMNPRVDFYFAKSKKWQEELSQLRLIMLDTGLTEDLKWGVPCYTLDKKNVALIHDFKEYCAILFFKGALLKDGKKILIQQTKNVQAARQARFTAAGEITKNQPTLKSYLKEAIALEKAGSKVEMKKTNEYEVPDEFQQLLDKKPALKKAFYALTPGRQRGYLLHFSAPRQSATRTSRVEKAMVKILIGKGLNDD